MDIKQIVGLLFGGETDDGYEDDLEEIDEEELAEMDDREMDSVLKKEKKYRDKKGVKRNTYTDYEEEDEPESYRKSTSYAKEASSGKVVSLATKNGVEVCICKPNNYGDSQTACSTLMSGHAVVVNLEGLDYHEAQRVMDVIYGCIYAIHGTVHQVSANIFIFSPNGVDVSGDFIETSDDTDALGIPGFDGKF